MKILMVCMGNICRSPMAEGILRHKARQRGLSIHTDSAGTSRDHVGELPDDRAIQCMKSFGLDITDLRARQFATADFDHFDLIFTMDRYNHRDVLELARHDADKRKVQMLLELTYPGENRSVPDPWFGIVQFDEVYDLLDKACDKLLDTLP